MTLWVPEAQRRRELKVRRQHEAELLGMVETKGVLDQWTRELRQVDPYLELVKARDDANLPSLKAGYYAILRHNITAPPSVLILEGPEGEFREPGSWIFDLLRATDLWNDEGNREHKRRMQRLEEQKQKAQRVEREEINAELHDRLKVANNGSIHVSKLPYKENPDD